MSTHLAWALSEYPPSDVGFVEEPFLAQEGKVALFDTRADARVDLELYQSLKGKRTYVIRVRVTVEAV